MRSIIGGMIVGSLLSIIGSFGYLYYQYNFLINRDPSQIFEVQSLDIPDFKTGENPKVSYETDIKEKFKGSFKIDIVHVNTNIIVCQYSSNGEYEYKPGRRVSQTLRTLEWLLDSPISGYDKECYTKLPPGLYQIQISYTLRQNEYTYDYIKNSNFFSIMESK